MTEAKTKMKRVTCPQCGRAIAVMANGQMHRHRTAYGIACRGRLDNLVPAEDRRVANPQADAETARN
jgi:hypothetical protein